MNLALNEAPTLVHMLPHSLRLRCIAAPLPFLLALPLLICLSACMGIIIPVEHDPTCLTASV